MKKLLLFGLLITSVSLFAQPRFRMASNGTASWTSLGGGKYQATVNFLSDQLGQGFLPSVVDTSFYVITGTEQIYKVDSVLSTTFTQATIRILQQSPTASSPIGQVELANKAELATFGQIPFGSLGATAQLNAAIDEYNARRTGARMDSLAAINDSTLVYFDANGNPLDTVNIQGGDGGLLGNFPGNTTKFAPNANVVPDSTGSPSIQEIKDWNDLVEDTAWLNSVVFYTGTNDSSDIVTYVYYIDGSDVVTLLESPANVLNITRRAIPGPAFANSQAPEDSEVLGYIATLSPPAAPATIFNLVDGALPTTGTADNPEVSWFYDGTNVTRFKDFPRKREVPDSVFADTLAPTVAELDTWITGLSDDIGNNYMFYLVGSGTVENPDYIWKVAGDFATSTADYVTIKSPTSGVSSNYMYVTTDSFSTFSPSSPAPSVGDFAWRTTTGNLWEKTGASTWTRRSLENGTNASTIINVSNDTLTWNANLNNHVRLTVPSDSADCFISAPTNISSQFLGETFLIGITSGNEAVTIQWDTAYGNFNLTDFGPTVIPTGTTINYEFRVINDGGEEIRLQNVDAAVGSTIDTSIIATKYGQDTSAQAIRNEIAALAQPPFDSTDISTGGIGNTDLASGIVSTTKIADDAVTLVKMANGTANRLILYDASGNPSAGTVSGIASLSAGNLAVTEIDGNIANEGLLTVGAGTGSTSIINSNTSGSTGVTITAGTGLGISEAGNIITLANSSPDQTVTITGGGINNVTGTYPNFTVTGTEVDGGAANEGLLTVGAGTGTTSLIQSNTTGSNTITLTGAGIATVNESGNTITITATEVDGSPSNELQTIANTSDATSHTVTLSNSGGSIQLVEGSGVTLTTTGTSGAGVVTIASSGSGSPGGSNTQVQFNNAGSFGGDSDFTFDGTNVGIGAAPVTATRLVIKNLQEPSRATVVTTQGFAADTTNWTRGAGWTFAGGVATATAASSDLTYTPALTITSGVAYEVTYTLSGYSAGTFSVKVGNATYTLPSHNATANVVLLLPTSATGGFRFTAASATGSVDNVSIVAVSNPATAASAVQLSSSVTLYNEIVVPNSTTTGQGGGVKYTTGSNNAANGYQALYFNTTGSSNAANGYQALYSNTTGGSNAANGLQALYSNTTGAGNIANGYRALYSNTTGSNNAANGTQALYFNTTGSNNTANGTSAGRYAGTSGTTPNETSSNSLYEGANTRASASGASNESVIGPDAVGQGSNTVTIGHTTVTDAYIRGNIRVNSGDVIYNQDGSAAAPAYAWENDTNTGIYRPATDVIGFALGGVESARITTTQLTGLAGSAAAPFYSTTSDPNTGMYSGGADVLSFATGGALLAHMTTTGLKIGGATTNDSWGLHILKSTSAGMRIATTSASSQGGYWWGDDSNEASYTASALWYNASHASKANTLELRTSGANPIRMAVGGTNRVSAVNAGGEVNGTLSVSGNGGTATTLTGRDASEYITDVTVGVGLKLSSGTLKSDTIFVTLNPVPRGTALTQAAGTDFDGDVYLVPAQYDGKLCYVDYALLGSTATTGSLTIGMREVGTTNTLGGSNQAAGVFSGSQVRAFSSSAVTLAKGEYLFAEVNPAIAGTLDVAPSGLVVTLKIIP